MSSEEDDDAYQKFLVEQKNKVNKRYVSDSELEKMDDLDDFIVSNEFETDDGSSLESDDDSNVKSDVEGEEEIESEEEIGKTEINNKEIYSNYEKSESGSENEESNSVPQVASINMLPSDTAFKIVEKNDTNKLVKNRHLLFSSESDAEKEDITEIIKAPCIKSDTKIFIDNKKISDELNLKEKKEAVTIVKKRNATALFSSESDSESDTNIKSQKKLFHKNETTEHIVDNFSYKVCKTPIITKKNNNDNSINFGRKPLISNNLNQFVTPKVKCIKATVKTVPPKARLLSRLKAISYSDSENDDTNLSLTNDDSDDSEIESGSERDFLSSKSEDSPNKAKRVLCTPVMTSKTKSVLMEKLAMTVPMNKASTKLDFISSLLDDFDDKDRDLDSIRYRNKYKTLKKDLALKIYAIYNEKVFLNKLPIDIDIRWLPKLTKTAGRCHLTYIKNPDGTRTRHIYIDLSIKVLTDASRLLRTLGHEMCHGATHIINKVKCGHGPIWQTWTFELRRVFPRLPVMTRCHSYKIKSKYQYWCENCQRGVNRHSKSIDITKKVCGRCRGKFTLFVNMANGERKMVGSEANPLQQQQNLTGFAGFVKEHYKKYRKEGVTHGEVMKILGDKYRQTRQQEVDGGLSDLMTGMRLKEG